MRKKTTGAPSMDFQISPDDRIGGRAPKARGNAKAPAKNPAKGKKPAKGQRVEPGFRGVSAFEEYEEPAPRRGRAPKARKTRQKKKQRRGFSFWRLFGKLFYWMATLGTVAAIC